MARKLFSLHKWPVIDVSHRSIEEASAHIVQLFFEQFGEPDRGRP